VEQRPESRLLEMPVTRQCVLDAFLLHNHERNAIRQLPFFVRPVQIKRQPTPQQFMACRNQLAVHA
jgi:hypothetical protein